MKKNILTKAATLAVALLMVSSLSACGGAKQTAQLVDGKPSEISVMATTILNENNGHTEFCNEYERQTGIKLRIEKPEHNQYYEKVGITFAAEEPCDVIELGSTYYPSYAAEGVLWDMTDAWENSDLKASGIVNEKYIDGMRCDGDVATDPAATDRIYGFPNQRGGGTVTYVRKDWMNALGIEDPKSYEEFRDMLVKFKDIKSIPEYAEKYGKQDIYPLTSAGLISTESPYEIYLREFYQDARPDVHYDEKQGKYVDGVLEPEMADALARIKEAWQLQIIDPGAVSNKTSTCRDKFQNGTVGAFNYWAGTWMRTLNRNMTAKDPDAIIYPLPSFDKEKEYYIERPATAYVITNFCPYPQEVFDNFILFSHDGGNGQLLFTHGVEDVHYTVTAKKDASITEKGVADNIISAEALPTMADPNTLFEKSFYDGPLSITEFDDPIAIEDEDLIRESLAVFDDSLILYDLPVMDTVVGEQLPEIEVAKQQLLTNLVIEDMSVEKALETYAEATKAERRIIFEHLNGEYEEYAGIAGGSSDNNEDDAE